MVFPGTADSQVLAEARLRADGAADDNGSQGASGALPAAEPQS